MKDYSLSEIKTHCKKMQEEYGSNACDMCENTHYEVEQFCIHKIVDDCPCEWEIEPRDMIELPCKEQFYVNEGTFRPRTVWSVIFRDDISGAVSIESFNTEPEADEFIAKLKEKNNE